MKIAMVSEHASPLALVGGQDAGGQNVYVYEIAMALGNMGHEVTVYTRRDSPTLAAEVALSEQVTVVHVPAGPAAFVDKDDMLPLMDQFAEFLAAHWRENTPQVVHSHFWMSGYAALQTVAQLKIAIPIVHSYHALGTVKRRHQGAKDTSPSERIAIEAEIGQKATILLASCRDEKAELEAMGVDPYKIRIVPGGIDLSLFKGERVLHTIKKSPIILSVGRLVERKGVDTIIQALAQIPRATLLIAGGPDKATIDGDPDVARLKATAQKHKVSDRVQFLGRVARADLCGVMRTADAIVAVPWYEPFGIVPVEAMASGTPLIASGVGGMLDSVIDGQTGFLVPPRDPVALAAKLQILLSDPLLANSISKTAMHHARQNFSWQHVAQLTVDSYQSAIGS